MECPSCFDVYDEDVHIPRNLPCGHTYCELCLKKYLAMNARLECFSCRTKAEVKTVSQLSKNFIAAELASKQKELQKKALLCPEHAEVLRFFCENCQRQICDSCIIDHSGHNFIKQDQSVQALRTRISKLRELMTTKINDLTKAKSLLENTAESIKQKKEAELLRLEQDFTKLMDKVKERKEVLVKDFEITCKEEEDQYSKELASRGERCTKLQSQMEEIAKLNETLGQLKVITGDDLLKQIEDLESRAHKDLHLLTEIPTSFEPNIPKVIFETRILSELQTHGFVCLRNKNPKIVYFGEKNKILYYVIEKNEWKSIKLDPHSYPKSCEFNYYSSAATLPTGEIVITGGGITRAASIFNFEQKKLRPLPEMNEIRKEHATVYLNDGVYVLGGYDGKTYQFLSSCEKYDPEAGKWSFIQPMKTPKCAFGACAVNNRYLFTVGGYDGNQRLNIIERYDSLVNEWTTLDVKLKDPLSNCACFSPNDNSIVILGGGCNHGFSYDVQTFNLTENKFTLLSAMPEGRDLRNKIVYSQGIAFAIGGNNCKAERLNFLKNEWTHMASYIAHVNDNLDSWACALTFDTGKNNPMNGTLSTFPQLEESMNFLQPPPRYLPSAQMEFFEGFNYSLRHNNDHSLEHNDISYQQEDVDFDESY